MTKFFNKLKKKNVFGPFLVHFHNSWGKQIFLENPALSRTTSHWFLAPYQNLEKTNAAISRKRLGRWKDGRTDERTEERTDPIL